MKEDAISRERPDSLIWDKAGLWALYALGFLLPLWVLPFTANPSATNKVALSYFLIIAVFIFWLVGRIQSGRVELPKNYIALAMILVVAVWFISGLFSISSHISFSELSGDPSSFYAILMFSLAGFVAYFYLRDSEKIFLWLSAVFSSATIVFIVQLFRVLFGWNVFFGFDLPFATSNLFGSWTEFGIFFSIVGTLSLFLFELFSDRKFRLTFLGLSIASFAVLILVNNTLIWWTTLAFLLVIMAYLLSLMPKPSNIFRFTLLALLATLLFVQTPAISSRFISYFSVDSLEVRPSWPASWAVVQKSLDENPLLGSGPATFVYDWLRFKPLAVNESVFWSVRFSGGAAFAPSLLALTGILGFGAFLFLAVSFLYYFLRILVGSGEKKLDPIFVLVILGTLMIFAYSFVYGPGFILTLFLFIFLGMFMALLSGAEFVKEYKITLFQNSGVGFISSLVLIFLLIISFSGLYLFGQKYASAYFFGRVLEKESAGDTEGAASYLQTAINLDGRDIYYRKSADQNLSQIASLLSRDDISAEDLRGSFQNILSQAIQSAQTAINLNPTDPLNWFSLGGIYEAVIPFQISGASDFAASAYQQAERAYPTSPEPILAQARVTLAAQNLDEAKSLLERALELKQNYTAAHFLLAQVEDAKGNLAGAISRAEASAVLSPNDLGALFQLGLLYYRADRLSNARVVFERAISLNSSYSNGRYFLGLIYSRLGERERSIEQFEIIKSLNPENQEVKKILENLREGRNALSGVLTPPEERTEPPLGEE